MSNSPTRRRTSRGVRRGATCALAAGVVLAAPVFVSPALPTAGADDCPDVAVTFARGTDEPAGLGRVGAALVSSLREQTGMNVDAYGVDYKASLFQLHTDDGSKDAVAHVKSMADKCPDTPQVLGGYSQGASVMDIVAGVSVDGLLRGTELPAKYADNVAAVVTFGNIAVRTNKPISSASALLGSKAKDFCNPADPICHEGSGNSWSGHTEGYVPFYTDQAASFVMTKLVGPGAFPGATGLTPSYPGATGSSPAYPGLVYPGLSPADPTNSVPPYSAPAYPGLSDPGTAGTPADTSPAAPSTAVPHLAADSAVVFR